MLEKHLTYIEEDELLMSCFYSIINLKFYNNLNNIKEVISDLFLQKIIKSSMYILNNLYSYNLYLINEYSKNENEVYIKK